MKPLTVAQEINRNVAIELAIQFLTVAIPWGLGLLVGYLIWGVS